MRQASLVALLAALAASFAGCKDSGWIKGKWLLVTEEGKPGVCHEFGDERKLTVYVGTACEGETDPLMSGKYQVKGDKKVVIQRGNDDIAYPMTVTERSEDRLEVSGAISGTLYSVGEKGAEPLITKLEQSGKIKVRALPDERGCKQLGMSLGAIKKLPKEGSPRMIRRRDQGLEYHADTSPGDPAVEKVVYALNQDLIDWIAFHLKADAFEDGSPRSRLEAAIGAPESKFNTGSGETQQVIAMWRAYCPDLRGAKNKDVDLTLFATPAEKRGTIYVSEEVISAIWEDLKATANDPEAQMTAEEIAAERGEEVPEEEAEPAAKPAAAEAPAPEPTPEPAPKPAAKPQPAPSAPEPAKPAKPAPQPAPEEDLEDDI